MQHAHTGKYIFGDYTLQYNETLKKGDSVILVPPKELHVLSVLVANAGEVVEKEAIIESVWKGGIVNDESLTRCIYTIRKILNEDKLRRCVETVYGKGYIFVLPVLLATDIERGNVIQQNTLAVFPNEKHYLNDFPKIYTLLVESIPSSINIFSLAILRQCHSKNDVTDFLENHQPEYIIKYTEVSDKLDSSVIEFSIENRSTGREDILASIRVSHPWKRESKKLRNIIKNHLSKDFNIEQMDVVEGYNYSCSNDNEIDSSIYIRDLINNYDRESLLLAVGITFDKIKSRPDDVMNMLYLSECYLGLLLTGGVEAVHRIVYKIQVVIERVLFVEPLNAIALSIMGMVKIILGDSTASSHCFAQAKHLAPDNSVVTFYYAYHLFMKDEFRGAMDLIHEIEADSLTVGRVLLLRKNILTKINNHGVAGSNSHNTSSWRAFSNELKDDEDQSLVHQDNDESAIYNGKSKKKRLYAKVNDLKKISHHSLRINDGMDWF